MTDLLPDHISLSIDHNEHKVVYQTVSEFLANHEIESDDFVSPECMEKAIQMNELWTLTWYPKTPVGFCRVHSHSFASILEYLKDNPGC